MRWATKNTWTMSVSWGPWREAWHVEGHPTLSRFHVASNIKMIERSGCDGCEPAAPQTLAVVSPLDQQFRRNAVWPPSAIFHGLKYTETHPFPIPSLATVVGAHCCSPSGPGYYTIGSSTNETKHRMRIICMLRAVVLIGCAVFSGGIGVFGGAVCICVCV